MKCPEFSPRCLVRNISCVHGRTSKTGRPCRHGALGHNPKGRRTGCWTNMPRGVARAWADYRGRVAERGKGVACRHHSTLKSGFKRRARRSLYELEVLYRQERVYLRLGKTDPEAAGAWPNIAAASRTPSRGGSRSAARGQAASSMNGEIYLGSLATLTNRIYIDRVSKKRSQTQRPQRRRT